ncbi:MAG: Ribosomal protein [Planctomycetota bacterium]|jgi:large subunit ribosomal protein L29
MEAREIRKLTDDQIATEIAAQRRRIFDLRSQAVTEKVADTSQFRTIRRTIARLLTERSTRTKTGAKA